MIYFSSIFYNNICLPFTIITPGYKTPVFYPVQNFNIPFASANLPATNDEYYVRYFLYVLLSANRFLYFAFSLNIITFL